MSNGADMNVQDAAIDELNEFDIAIIGMAGRFPGANTVEQYWQNLCNGVESITEFSDADLDESGILQTLYSDPDYVKAAPILDEPGQFDAPFFGYSPREARTMDPQHRLFLQCAWHALEDAGYNIEQYSRPVGIYGGAAMNTYFMFSGLASQFVDDYLPTLIGNDNSFLTTRVSYKLNLTGPSVTVQTACSTSLVAVHHAVQSLYSGECDMALAGGVAVRVPHKAGHLYQNGSVFTPDGHCRSFDADAKGTIFGSGVGIVVLKRLEDAVNEQDHIYAVVKGTAINNDGSSKVDYTAPSVGSQAAVISEALANSGLNARDISYIEAHGTGTSLGDPIEVAALTQAFRADTEDTHFCTLSSVKTNIGHLDAAAGIAGLIKTALCLKHQQLPPTLHYKRPNPQINFAETPFFVKTELSEWNHSDGPRYAGVSSLGIGGTNAHVILGEAPQIQPLTKGAEHVVLPISARTPEAVSTQAANLAGWLKRHPELALADVAHTLLTGRKQFTRRSVIACASIEDAIAELDKVSASKVTDISTAAEQPIAFMFPGQGSQYVQMGRNLYDTEPVFRGCIDRCASILQELLDLDIRSLIYPESDEDAAAEKLNNTYIAQPAIFIIEYSLAQLLLSWGIRPSLLCGHSVGEYVAACIADIFSVEDALNLVANRGRLMQALPSGSMLAISLSESDLNRYLIEGVSIAAVNDSRNCVVSGPEDKVAQLSDRLNDEGISSRPLHTSHAFHSAMMDPILEEFTALVSTISTNVPSIPIISTADAKSNDSVDFTSADYWARNLRNTVRFFDALQTLENKGAGTLIEVGPGTALSAFAKQNSSPDSNQRITSTMRHPKQDEDDRVTLLRAVGALWESGHSIDWHKIIDLQSARRVPLPGYAFEQTSYWLDSSAQATPEPVSGKGTISYRDDTRYHIPSWKRGTTHAKQETVRCDQESCLWIVFEKPGTDIATTLGEFDEGFGEIVRVIPSNSFRKVDSQNFEVNVAELDSTIALFEHLLAGDITTLNVLHCLAYDESHPDEKADHSVGVVTTDEYFFSLVNIAKALSTTTTTTNSNVDLSIKLGIISTDLHEVIGGEAIAPAKSLLLGPCRVIAKEYPDISTYAIDFSAAAGQAYKHSQFGQVVNELTKDTTGQTVAYRNGYRWIPNHERLDTDSMDDGSSVSLHGDGVYLITGGLNGIGYEVAAHLASTYRCKLALLGRSAIPEREQWELILAERDNTDPISVRIKRIQNLEQMGSTVLALSANVADSSQVESIVVKIENQLGKISGVFHAAGVSSDGLIELRNSDSMRNVLAPKVSGTQNLCNLLDAREPEFLVLFSSINSILAPAGQVAYSAANAFMDAMAVSSRSRTYPVMSINWPGWQGIGMFGRMEESVIPNDQATISATEGIESLQSIISAGLPNVIVYPGYFPPGMMQQGSKAVAKLTSSDKTNQKGPVTNVESDSIIETISATWTELLGIEAPHPTDNFFALGGSSLIATQMFSRLSKIYGVKLNLRVIFDAQTPEELAKLLDDMIEPSKTSTDQDKSVEEKSVDDILNLL